MKALYIAAAAALGVTIPGALYAQCPAFGSATAGCDVVITLTNSGLSISPGPSFSIAGGTYDAVEDTLVGVVNNSSSPVSSFVLSANPNVLPNDIFGFDGDGVDTYGAPSNPQDNSGYGGPDAYFTAINAAFTSGTVNFVTPLAANGGSTYFSLEETPSALPVGTTPEPSSLVLLGTGLAGLAGAVRRRFTS